MSRSKALARTAALILVGALCASGVNAAFATDASTENLARKGVADFLVERFIL